MINKLNTSVTSDGSGGAEGLLFMALLALGAYMVMSHVKKEDKPATDKPKQP